MRQRFFISKLCSFLFLTVVGLGLTTHVRSAEACSPPFIRPGLDVGEALSPSLDKIPLDGRWAFPATMITTGDGMDVVIDITARDLSSDPESAFGDESGTVKILPTALPKQSNGYTYQKVLVVWTPVNPLSANREYKATVRVEVENDGTPVPDAGWEQSVSFFTSGKNGDAPVKPELADDPQTQVLELPAQDMQCTTAEEHCTSCGCETLTWSTTYTYVPQVEFTLDLYPTPTDAYTQQYTVVSSADGDVYEVIWTGADRANITHQFQDDDPITFTMATYTFDNDDEPIHSVAIVIDPSTFDEPTRHTFDPEDAPQECDPTTIRNVSDDEADTNDDTNDDTNNGNEKDDDGDNNHQNDGEGNEGDKNKSEEDSGCGSCDASSNPTAPFYAIVMMGMLLAIRPSRVQRRLD